MPDLACGLSSGFIFDFAGETSVDICETLRPASPASIVAATIDTNAANKKTTRINGVRMALACRSAAGFGGDQIPVWIARHDLPGESPDVGDAGDRVCAAIDHIAVTIAGR